VVGGLTRPYISSTARRRSTWWQDKRRQTSRLIAHDGVPRPRSRPPATRLAYIRGQDRGLDVRRRADRGGRDTGPAHDRGLCADKLVGARAAAACTQGRQRTEPEGLGPATGAVSVVSISRGRDPCGVSPGPKPVRPDLGTGKSAKRGPANAAFAACRGRPLILYSTTDTLLVSDMQGATQTRQGSARRRGSTRTRSGRAATTAPLPGPPRRLNGSRVTDVPYHSAVGAERKPRSDLWWGSLWVG